MTERERRRRREAAVVLLLAGAGAAVLIWLLWPPMAPAAQPPTLCMLVPSNATLFDVTGERIRDYGLYAFTYASVYPIVVQASHGVVVNVTVLVELNSTWVETLTQHVVDPFTGETAPVYDVSNETYIVVEVYGYITSIRSVTGSSGPRPWWLFAPLMYVERCGPVNVVVLPELYGVLDPIELVLRREPDTYYLVETGLVAGKYMYVKILNASSGVPHMILLAQAHEALPGVYVPVPFPSNTTIAHGVWSLVAATHYVVTYVTQYGYRETAAVEISTRAATHRFRDSTYMLRHVEYRGFPHNGTATINITLTAPFMGEIRLYACVDILLAYVVEGRLELAPNTVCYPPRILGVKIYAGR